MPMKCDGDNHVFPSGAGFCQCGKRYVEPPIPKEIPAHYGLTTPTGWICPKCEAVHAPDVKTCPNCGPKGYEELRK